MSFIARATLFLAAGIVFFAQEAASRQDGTFSTVIRPGSVNLQNEYDLAGLAVPLEQIHRLLPRDAIPALTDPVQERAEDCNWLKGDSRIIVSTVGEESLGVPLAILDQHEIVNVTLAAQPIAITYCPLCDSATVFSRTVSDAAGNTLTLEFGVSGALYNSNVLMFDRTHRGLWSQLGMKAVSGPMAGTQLELLPVALKTFDEFKRDHPSSPLVSSKTGHRRDYKRDVYADYFRRDDLLVPVKSYGDALPRKTLGVGVMVDGQAWFIPSEKITGVFELETPHGVVKISRSDAGIQVIEKPSQVNVAQSFYYSWSAFFPKSEIVGD